MGKQYFTKEKFDSLKKELNELKTEKRLEVADRLKKAKELGDLSENSEYFEAREEQALLEGRIFELEEMLRNYEIIEKGAASGIVKIGSTIEIKRGEQKNKFTIVGSNEAKPETGLISNESPLGKAFLDKKVDDIVIVTIPNGKKIEYKILSIK
ncbi:MAG: transcription elongation factor GreA [Parcubacteria group bacterium Athens0714_26]|nr:MAG: transcription elongation factor GreA [Parcubacteria group bacterium Athens1014_26]TSD03289.1 MAG: transcription elongation factor GreA [Parcubacteria group bacterium Athens0714_26]